MREQWQQSLADGFSCAKQLLTHLDLPHDFANDAAHGQFATRVPKGFVAKMQKGNPNDPLLLQVLPSTQEMQAAPDFVLDPLHEQASNPLPGMLHKYHGRVLLTLTGSCAINCRYCFRRHFAYADNNPGLKGQQQILDYIAQDKSIFEVILSGGDPLLAKDKILANLITQLEAITHIKTLRIHSRIPIVLPERISDEFCAMMQQTRLNKVLVFHANHPQELDCAIKSVCDKLKACGFHLLNQSVLLKGINDDVLCLSELSHRLFDYGVMPYYLHLLDKVQGAWHFDVAQSQANELYRQLQACLPGYLVPRLVREIAGEKNKLLSNR